MSIPLYRTNEQPLGPADYLTITSEYSTIFIDQVPVLLLKNKNEARRLINLVDALCKPLHVSKHKSR
jgi:predicted ATPase